MDMNSNSKVEVKLIQEEEGFAYDVQIKDAAATLWDYIESLDAFLEAKVAPCLGCDNCCYQRIPLTLPDIYNYAGRNPEAIGKFLREKCVVERCGPMVDIRLAQGKDGICVFLDGENQRCLDHSHRSLVCHTYICLPQTARARELREYLINQGEDALAAELLSLGLLQSSLSEGLSYTVPAAWCRKTYDEIILKEVLSPELWAALTATL